jgi:hypothetical protein
MFFVFRRSLFYKCPCSLDSRSSSLSTSVHTSCLRTYVYRYAGNRTHTLRFFARDWIVTEMLVDGRGSPLLRTWYSVPGTRTVPGTVLVPSPKPETRRSHHCNIRWGKFLDHGRGLNASMVSCCRYANQSSTMIYFSHHESKRSLCFGTEIRKWDLNLQFAWKRNFCQK